MKRSEMQIKIFYEHVAGYSSRNSRIEIRSRGCMQCHSLCFSNLPSKITVEANFSAIWLRIP